MLRLTEDLGAPAVVAAIDIGTEKVQPTWNEWASYITCGVGYVMGSMGMGGNFVKNLGVASFPWAIRHIVTRAGVFAAGQPSVSRIRRYPAPAMETPFQGVRLV